MIKIVRVLALCLGLAACDQTPNATPPHTVDTYTRVMSSGTIRCGYFDWPPVLHKDPNTGEFSGVGVDVITEIAARLKLKVSWDEESGPATVVESVKTGRVDMICLPIIVTMARTRLADFSQPVMFGRFYPWVRADTAIPDAADMNDPRYTFVAIDGSAGLSMIERLFPRARHVTLVENSPTSDLFSSVLGHKADAVYADTSNALTFDAANPGQIKPIRNPATAVSLPWSFMVAQDNYRFVRMIDLVLNDLTYDGTLDAIMQRNKVENYFMWQSRKPLHESATP